MAAPVATQEVRPLRELRIALLESDANSVDAECRDAVNASASALEHAGARVEPLRMAEFYEAIEVWHLVFCLAGGAAVRAGVKGFESMLSPTLLDFLQYVDEQPALTVESLLNGLVRRDQVRARVLRAMRPYAAVLAPVSSAAAFRHGEGGWGSKHPANYIDTMRCSQFANAMGLPALVVPAGRSSEGLPIGVQLIGRPYREETLFAVGAAIEKEFGFAWPPMAIEQTAAAG